MSGKAWSLLIIAGRRRYAGNLGYDDDPERIYRYDSAVGNSRHIAEGDLIVLRGRKAAIGFALVQEITAKAGEKERFRCPICNSATIHERTEALPKYRCENKHDFDSPVREVEQVTNYEAHYGNTFVSLDGSVSAQAVRSIVLRPSSQNSIEEIDPSSLIKLVASEPASASIFETFFQWSVPERLQAADLEAPFEPRTGDRRNHILKSIAARQGQGRFRRALVARYGAKCMATGSQLMSVVEAAHIWPYRGREDNHVGNGILLRSDIHTLFDLDLLGIEPNTMQIKFAPSLAGKEYDTLRGITLSLQTSKRPSVEALALRWQVFCAKHHLQYRAS